MEVIDIALVTVIREVIDGVEGFNPDDVYPGSPQRDEPPPFAIYGIAAGDRGELGRVSGIEGRRYEYRVSFISRNELQAIRARDAMDEALHRGTGLRLTVEGWPNVRTCKWLRVDPDPGDLIPGGVRAYLAGFYTEVALSRPTG